MIFSMTGYGRGEAEKEGHRVTVELTSVNGRYLEFQFRLPRELNSLEPRFKEILGETFSRGKISCVLVWKPAQGMTGRVLLNEPLAAMYREACRQIKEKLELPGDITVNDLITLPDIFTVEPEEIDRELVCEITESALVQARAELKKMRQAEGEKIGQDLSARVVAIAELIPQIETEAQGNIEVYRQKLNSRVKELFGENGYDPQRLAEEIAYIAERSDITEECVRLKIHVEHFAETLRGVGPMGRRLNFLSQEMNREANTIGSKGQSATISVQVVAIKEELEKIREQIQNIE